MNKKVTIKYYKMRKPIIKAIIRTDKADKKTGYCPICIQIRMDGDKKRISIGEKIHPSHWDTDAGRAIGKGYGNLNKMIDKRKNDLEEFCADTIIAGYQLSFSDIDKFLNGTKNSNFYDVFDSVMEIKKPKICDDTKYKYATLRSRLKAFQPRISTSNIDVAFITRFDNYLKGLNIGGGGIYNHHKCLKCIINEANRYKKAKIEQPYGKDMFTIKTLKHKTIFLDEEEVVKFKGFKSDSILANTVRDMFLLSCYSGLRYSDLFSLKVSDIDFNKGIISKKMLKTKHNINIPMNSQIKTLLLKYMVSQKSNTKIFREVSNQVGNSILKEIAKECKINKNITFHVGRHTFASYLVNNCNISLPIVSKLLGHVNIANTLIYTNSNINNLKNVMSNVRFG